MYTSKWDEKFKEANLNNKRAMADVAAQSLSGSSSSVWSVPAIPAQNHPTSSRLLGGRVLPKAKARKLAPLQVAKHDYEHYLHVQYSFNPGKDREVLEPITLTVSTPLPACTPLHKVDPQYLGQLVEKLGELYKLPSPESNDVSVHVDIKRHPYADLQVGDRWQEIQGSKDWEGLMDVTMDPVLRGELMRYGEFAQATYDGFEGDNDSKFCGDAKFDKEKLMEQVGLENRGYEIKEYIYATAQSHLPKFFRKSSVSDEDKWSKDSNFMGFVAVCTSPRELARLGRRDIVVAWRGTVTKLEWLENVQDFFSPAGLDPRGSPGASKVMVESGFLDVYKSKNENSRYNKMSAREQVLAAVRKLVQEYKDENLSISVTGHSLGSALSMLCAYDIAESGINKREHSPRVPRHWDHPERDAVNKHPQHDEVPMSSRVPVSVFSFAGPRLGNSAFKERVEQLGVKVLRVVNVHDMVPRVPGIIFNENLEFLHKFFGWLPSSYVHIGRHLEVDTNESEYLRDTTDPVDAHNLEAYLHMLDGYHGPNQPFSPAVRRDIALVNKASDFLEHKFGIPANWWGEKEMVKDPQTGHWVVRQTLLEPEHDGQVPDLLARSDPELGQLRV